jgi:hypothetical protein
LSEYQAEGERLRKLYDQARIMGDKKKKKEYKEKILQLNRARKQATRSKRKNGEFSTLDSESN